MEPKIDLNVRRHGRRWFTYLVVDGDQTDVMACSLKQDIGWCCREMLRWQDKTDNSTPHTRSARRRQTTKPKGKVWTAVQLNQENT